MLQKFVFFNFKLFLIFSSPLFLSFEISKAMLSPELPEEKQKKPKTPPDDDFDCVKFANILGQLSDEDFVVVAQSYDKFPQISDQIFQLIKNEAKRRKDRPPTPKPVRFHRKTPFPLKIPESTSSSTLVVPVPQFHKKKPSISFSQANLGNTKLNSKIIRDTSFGRKERSWAVLTDHASPTTASTTGQPSFTENPKHDQSSTTVTSLQPAGSIIYEDFDEAVSDAGVEELDPAGQKIDEGETDSPPKDSRSQNYEIPPPFSFPKRRKPELFVTIPAQVAYGLATVGSLAGLALTSAKDQISRSKTKKEIKKIKRIKRILMAVGFISFCALVGSIIYNQTNSQT